MALFSLCRAGAGRVLARPEPEMRPNEHVVVVLLPFFGRPGHRHQFTFSSSDSLLYIFRVLVERTGVASGQGEKKKKICFDFPPRVCTENDNVTFV
jgi:hypothetical protein